MDKTEAGNKKILSSKWIFKEKDNGQSEARLVIRGCEQDKKSILRMFSVQLVNSCSLRVLLDLAVKKNGDI